MCFKKDLKELEELKLPKESYVIVGSGPLAVRGIRDCRDIDIVVNKDVWEELKKKYPKNENGSIKRGNVEIVKEWLPWIGISKEVREEVEIIDGHPYAKLHLVLKWKRVLGRKKDKADIELIERFLEAQSN